MLGLAPHTQPRMRSEFNILSSNDGQGHGQLVSLRRVFRAETKDIPILVQRVVEAKRS